MSNTDFYQLNIKETKAETADSVTITFEIPADLKETFAYKQGQYLTLKTTVNGEEVRRAYSLCSSPLTDKELSVSVKKVSRGKMSGWLHSNAKAGVSLDVMPPQGRFFTEVNADNKKDYFLVGAGSGITPLLSITKTVLEAEPKSRVFLLYSNRNEESIMFRDELERLEKRYAGQLTVEHILSQPKTEKAGGLGGLFKKPKMSWTGLVGRIDAKNLAQFIDKHSVPDGRGVEYFLCGPAGMMEIAEKTLEKRGANNSNVHAEWFVSAKDNKAASGGDSHGVVTATLHGKQYTVSPKGKETILDALRNSGVDAPFSCMAGACATCMAKVTKGSVKMDSCFALDDDEVAKGYCLTCQAKPESDEVELTFDV